MALETIAAAQNIINKLDLANNQAGNVPLYTHEADNGDLKIPYRKMPKEMDI